MRILVVEDEVKLNQTLQRILASEGYAVDGILDGEEALEEALANEYDLVILDIGLPNQDGMSICKTLRASEKNMPILMLTARDGQSDKVRGLDAGADDYLIKPFDVDELLARIRSLIRRKSGALQSIKLVGSLEINLSKKNVSRMGKMISLSAKEYALLEYLVIKSGSIISKEELLEHVWDMNTDPFTKVVDVYIGYLRQKIDKPFPQEKPLINTIKGMGYRIGDQ